MRRLSAPLLTAAALFTLASAVPVANADAKRVYHVGNSVTDTINYDGLAALAAQRGHAHTSGRHMIPGAPLGWIWERGVDGNGDGVKNDPSGFRNPIKPGFDADTTPGYDYALPQLQWDAVTLQPFDRQIQGDGNDLQMAGNFINLALTNPANANTQFYLYQRWPRRDTQTGPIDYAQKWDRTYTGGWDGTNESRDFFEDLLVALRTQHAGLAKPILMVPVGDVLYELDKRMEAGQVAGYTDIVQVYSDGIHFNNVGSFLVGTTFYATLYKDNPAGLSVPSQYGSIDAALAGAIQDVVWDVVSTHTYSGVVPEPTAAAAAAMLAAPWLLRRR